MGKRSQLNLVGQRFTRLLVLSKAEPSRSGHIQWNCLCDCGNHVVATSSNLQSGAVKSCGCYNRDKKREKSNQTGLGVGWDRQCAYCGKTFRAYSHKTKFCSEKCKFLGLRKEQPSGCIEWEGTINGQGYGVLQSNVDGKKKIVQAHRYAWRLFRGEIPDGMCVCHKCDNRKCTNPDHLFLGTWKDNNQDRSRKGRSGSRVFSEQDKQHYSQMNRGSHNNQAKLTEEKVCEIWRLKGVMPYKKIGEKFGVSKSVITSIFNRRSWKHVQIPRP